MRINDDGNHYLSVSAGARITDRPGYHNGSQLSIKYNSDRSLSLATNSFSLEMEPLTILPKNYKYLGHKSIILPNNPNEITQLELIISVHTIGNYTGKATAASKTVNLLNFIQYGK